MSINYTDRDVSECIKRGGGGHYSYLANATKRSVSGGDASLCQITLTTYCSFCAPSPTLLIYLRQRRFDSAPVMLLLLMLLLRLWQ